MKLNNVAFMGLLLPLTAQSADITLSDINARLEVLERELQQSRAQLVQAERKIDSAEKTCSSGRTKYGAGTGKIAGDTTITIVIATEYCVDYGTVLRQRDPGGRADGD